MPVSMTVRDMVDTVSTRAGIAPAMAGNAVGTIFSILMHEAGGSPVSTLFAKIPGAADLAAQYDVMATVAAGAAAPAGGGGLFGMISGALGSVMGAKAQPVLNGIARLKESGLGLGQIEAAGATLIAELRSVGGHDLVNSILASAPMLASHIGGAVTGAAQPAAAAPA